MADVADEVKVTRVAIRGLETGPAFAEIDLPRHAGTEHPLQGAIDRRAADAGILATDDIEQIVGAEMPLLAQEQTQDEITFAGALAPRRAQARDVRERAFQGCSRRVRLRPEP